MIAPIGELKTHWEFWHVLVTAVGSVGGWETVKASLRGIFNKVVNSMPPLPANATWRETWFYAIAKAFASKEVVAANAAKGTP